jgi:integrase
VHLELIDASPYASLDKKLVLNGAKLAPRQRVLSDEEIFAFWRATRRLHYPERQLYQLLLMTGCRWSEVNGASWSEFRPELRKVLRDYKASGKRIDWATVPDAHKLWTVPADRFKSDQVHTVPLTNAMCELLATLPMKGPFLFSFDGGDAPMWAQSRTKATIDAHMVNILKAMARKRGDDADEVTLPHWVNHDLRRVVRTKLSDFDVDDVVAEMVLGHGRKGIARVYDRAKRLPQIRAALTKWNSRLVELAA